MSLKKKVVWLPYDFDTAIGINNEGKLVFGYELEDIDHLEGGADVYNGQESVIWKNIRAAFADELAAMYKTLRSTGALSYDKVEQMFEEHQSKWPERLANEDSKFKYTDPGVEDGNWSYLEMLQGMKTEQRKWWLYNRFRYIDSKYNAGDALSDLIQLRGYAKANVTVTPYADIYPTVKYGSYLVRERGHRGTATTLVCPLDNVNDTEIYIYSSSQLASVGDLSGLKVGFADFSMATRLQAIKIGDNDPEYENRNLTALTLGNNILLKTLDVRNCPSLGTGDQKSVDISGCEIIEEVYFDGTSIQGLTLPNGGVLKKLHLPSTMTNLTILNQKAITEFVIPSYANISTLRLENVSAAIDEKAILQAIPASSRVRLIGIEWECEDAEEIEGLLDILDTMRGLDESGRNVDKAQISGRIHIPALTGPQKSSFEARYPYINYDADYLETTLTLKTWDGSSIVTQITCYNGVPQSAIPSAPARTATAQYNYTPVGWNTSMDAKENDAACVQDVISDRTVYAAYSRTVRTYTVTFVRASADGGGTLQTLTNIAYGRTLNASSYTGSTPATTKGDATDYPFEGWTPAFAPITGNTTYTAKFGSPFVDEEITDSWATIINNIDNGTYKERYKLGNYKPVDFGTEGTINMQIVAFDADVDKDQNTIPITFIGKELLVTKRQHNTAQNSNGGWGNSLIRTYLNSTLLANVPNDIKNRITKATKKQAANSTVSTTYDSLWMPSRRELGLGLTSESSIAPVYSKAFTSDSARLRKIVGSTSGSIYWTRSSDSAYTYSPVNASGGSYVQYVGANNSYGVLVGFCLGYEPETITDSWSAILANENPSASYSVGDTKAVDLGTEGRHLMEIVAFDADDKADGTGKAKITWVSKTLLKTRRTMNKTETTAGGWESSAMRTILRETVMPLIPSTVRNGIVEVTKTQSVYQGGSLVHNALSTDTIWMPSYREVGYGDEYETEGAVYTINRAKKCAGSGLMWWLRTTYDDKKFHAITSNGINVKDSANKLNAIAIGFCTD